MRLLTESSQFCHDSMFLSTLQTQTFSQFGIDYRSENLQVFDDSDLPGSLVVLGVHTVGNWFGRGLGGILAIKQLETKRCVTSKRIMKFQTVFNTLQTFGLFTRHPHLSQSWLLQRCPLIWGWLRFTKAWWAPPNDKRFKPQLQCARARWPMVRSQKLNCFWS